MLQHAHPPTKTGGGPTQLLLLLLLPRMMLLRAGRKLQRPFAHLLLLLLRMLKRMRTRLMQLWGGKWKLELLGWGDGFV